MKLWEKLNAEIVSCGKCPRLVAYRQQVAVEKKREFRHWDYWGKPITGFGDLKARILLVGLAPAAHGGNRTGRIFTGDSSAQTLMKALHAVGLASQPFSLHRDDGLKLSGVYLTAVCRCAPPENKPTPEEIDNCLPYLVRELELLREVKVKPFSIRYSLFANRCRSSSASHFTTSTLQGARRVRVWEVLPQTRSKMRLCPMNPMTSRSKPPS